PPTPSADPGFEKDLIARTFGVPQWHADGDLLAMAYADDGTLWTVEAPGVLRQWGRDGRQITRRYLDWLHASASADARELLGPGDSMPDVETLWTFGGGARLLASASDELLLWDVVAGREFPAIEHESWFTA